MSPSRRERCARQVAQALAFITAITLLASALLADPVDPLGAIAAAVVALMGVRARQAASRRPIEVGVDQAGRPSARWADGSGEPLEGLQCIFAAPWLITFRQGTRCISIWPDSVPGNAFRRLWVHIRWNSGRPPEPSGVASGQPE